MRKLVVCVLFALLLVCSVVGLKTLAAQSGASIVVLADGGSPMPPIPR